MLLYHQSSVISHYCISSTKYQQYNISSSPLVSFLSLSDLSILKPSPASFSQGIFHLPFSQVLLLINEHLHTISSFTYDSRFFLYPVSLSDYLLLFIQVNITHPLKHPCLISLVPSCIFFLQYLYFSKLLLQSPFETMLSETLLCCQFGHLHNRSHLLLQYSEHLEEFISLLFLRTTILLTPPASNPHPLPSVFLIYI